MPQVEKLPDLTYNIGGDEHGILKPDGGLKVCVHAMEINISDVIYTTKIDGVVYPPNISETVAGRLMKLAHRQRIASTTIKLIFKKCTVHFINFSKNNSANRRSPGFG